MREPIVSYMPFFPSLREGIDRLKTDGERLEAYDMLTDYGLYGIEPDEESTPENLMLIFILVRPIIDKSIRDYENGKKGGRPKKEDEKPGIKPGLKRGLKTDKDKEKELDKEMEKDSPYPNSFKREGDRAPASADAAGASPLFTLEDFLECADENNLDMTEDEIRKCYQANRRKGFEPPKGKRSFSILGTLRGWHKNKAPAPDPEPAPDPKPKPKPKSKEGRDVPRKGNVPKREVLPDPVYGSVVVAKLINSIMLDGKKGTAQKIVYDAFDQIKEITGEDPLEVFDKAMNNIMPVLEVKARRVGGANYQVPMEVRPARRQTLGLRWLTNYTRARGEKTMSERLAKELLDAADNTGASVKKKEDTHRMAEANKAFAHYRF